MTYKWTKKRKAARNRLLTLAVFIVIVTPFQSALTNFNPSPQQYPVYSMVLSLLVLIGVYSVASDIIILVCDDVESYE